MRSRSGLRGCGLCELVFDHARDSILVLELREGKEPVVLAANPAALKLHGFTRQALIGKPVSVLGASLSAGGSAASDSGFEVKQRRRDGADIVTEVTARNVRSGGKLYGIVVERDVTRSHGARARARSQAARIMQAGEAEKKRLAAEVHDALGAMNVSLSAELLLLEEALGAGRKKEAAAALRRARGRLREASAELKRCCVESWPPALEVSGLEGALDGLLGAFAARTGARVRREIALPPGLGLHRMPESLVIYRLAREAVSNVERHSRAAAVHFRLSAEGGWLELEVGDDGRGFRPGAVPETCLGLRIMADAAANAGGYFSVYSAPGKGTRVRAQLPLPVNRGA